MLGGMASQLPNPPPGFDDLPPREQLAYVQSLWDRIVDRERTVPLPESHLEELERRLQAHRADPETGVRAWPAALADLRAELERRRSR